MDLVSVPPARPPVQLDRKVSARSAREARLASLLPDQIGAQYWFRGPTGHAVTTCAGLADRRASRPVTPETTFHCFSTTKPVTALAVLQLASEGRLSLDAPLTSYLPELPYRNGATVRQVLSHQAGLPQPLPLSWVHAETGPAAFDARAFFEGVTRKHSNCSAPGRRARYSNIGYLILGRLIEVVSGQAYESYVRERILHVVAGDATSSRSRLGFGAAPEVRATGYTRRWSMLGLFISLLPDPMRLRRAEGGWIRYQPFAVNGAAYGGLDGNVLGWAPLLTALATRDPHLLPLEGYDAFFAPQTLASGHPTGHALAWFTGKLGAHPYLCHAGGGPGFGAEVRIYPTLGAASALLTNTTVVTDTRHLDTLDRDWLP